MKRYWWLLTILVLAPLSTVFASESYMQCLENCPPGVNGCSNCCMAQLEAAQQPCVNKCAQARGKCTDACQATQNQCYRTVAARCNDACGSSTRCEENCNFQGQFRCDSDFRRCESSCGMGETSCRIDCRHTSPAIAGGCPGEVPAQKCPYNCQSWNSASKSCIGAAMNSPYCER